MAGEKSNCALQTIGLSVRITRTQSTNLSIPWSFYDPSCHHSLPRARGPSPFMPAFFPAPLPDELLYSIIGRFRDLMSTSSERAIVQTLFGSSSSTAVADLPCRIDALLSRLPPGSPVTARELILKHTTLPYYAPFLPPERVERAMALMRGDGGSTIHGVLGLRPSRIQTPRHLRFCSDCIDSDWNQFGIEYWHRVHQLPGVLVCPKHGALLKEHIGSGRSQVFASLAQVLKQGDVCDGVSSRAAIDQSYLLHLASETKQLLICQFRAAGLFPLQGAYRSLLADQGWMKGPISIRMSALRSAFTEYHGDSALKEFGCGLPSDRDGWLERLLRKPRTASHPLHHLLALKFLGCTVSRFLGTLLPEQNPQVRHSQTGAQGLSSGITGRATKTHRTPDTHDARWEARLISLVDRSTLSLRGIARELKVDPRTVQRHSRRLGVWRDEWRTWEKVAPSTRQEKRLEEQLREYRKDWIALCGQYPDESTNGIRRHIPAAYAFLYRNDRSWLEAHKPLRKPAPVVRDRVDWPERDRDFLDRAKLITEELLNSAERPTWIRKTTVLRRMHVGSRYFSNVTKLPRTTRFLDTISESRSEFACRKIRWSSRQFIEEGTVPERWELIRRASLRADLADMLAEEINVALRYAQDHVHDPSRIYNHGQDRRTASDA